MILPVEDVVEPAELPADRPRAPVVRSRIMLEIAAELVGRPGWDARQAQVSLRRQGGSRWELTLLGSDSPRTVAEVLAGRVDVAILNPATALRAAERRLGRGTGSELAAIATIPSYDQLGFAVSRRYGVATLAEVREKRLPLRVSLRAQRDHAVHQVVDDTLAAAGFSLADIEAWGGRLVYADGLPHHPGRWAAVADGTVDAVFDEGIYNWVGPAVAAGLSFVAVGDDALASMAQAGYRRARLRRQRFPALDADVSTVDFSGFLVYTRADTPDDVVRAFCEAMYARRNSIAWQGGPSLPLDRMCVDAVDAPLPVPLHPAAEAVWRAYGLT